MKKVSVLILMLIILAVAFAGCSTPAGYTKTIESNWEIALPQEAKLSETYSHQTEASFNGDGLRYHVFTYKSGEALQSAVTWTNFQKATLFADSFENAAAYWLSEIGVPDREWPEFENCRYYYKSQNDNSEIIIFWDAEQNKIYVAESFV